VNYTCRDPLLAAGIIIASKYFKEENWQCFRESAGGILQVLKVQSYCRNRKIRTTGQYVKRDLSLWLVIFLCIV
jgi:hypothetical protein